jgi:hypothetical protein
MKHLFLPVVLASVCQFGERLAMSTVLIPSLAAAAHGAVPRASHRRNAMLPPSERQLKPKRGLPRPDHYRLFGGAKIVLLLMDIIMIF